MFLPVIRILDAFLKNPKYCYLSIYLFMTPGALIIQHVLIPFFIQDIFYRDFNLKFIYHTIIFNQKPWFIRKFFGLKHEARWQGYTVLYIF